MYRTKYLVKNAKINVAFFLVNVFITFFSRKFFIDNLGADFLGLNTTISSILGFLLLTELGLGSAITYLLYKPLAKKNFGEVNKIINLLNYYYKRLGLVIAALGLIFSIFLIFVFDNNDLSFSIIYTAFYSYLLIALINYLFNFKQILVYADQKAFLIKKTLGICNILKVILQVFSVLTFGANLYLFLVLEVMFAIVTSIALNHLIKKTYPWLEILKENDFKYKTELLKNAKQIFSHRIGSFILTQTDQLLIYAYTSLKMVTFYNNYLMIVQFAVILTNQPFLSLHSAIGNLVVTNSKEKSYRVFQELLLLKYWLAGNVIFVLYTTLNPFIALWLDKSYILDHNIIVILLLNFFINIVRKPLDMFLQAFGIFHDTWAPFTEAGLNLVSSVILGYFYGIFGILLGSFISTLLIVCIWKPYLLFNQGFNLPVLFYFKKTIKYLIFYFFAAITAFHITQNILQHLYYTNKYIQFAISLCSYSMLFVTLYSLLFISFANESKPLVKRFNALIKSA